MKLDLKFPDSYPNNTKLQGKAVVFEVTINSAKRTVTPEYDLDFVKENTKYKTIKAYQASLEKEVYEEKETEAINNQKTSLWSERPRECRNEEIPGRRTAVLHGL